MLREEAPMMIDWAAAEGWNPGLDDAGVFFDTDPNGFFVGELDGAPIASLSAVAYDAGFGFMGFYLVRPEFRSCGYGLRLWHEALKYMGDRNVGLDGVADQQSNYAKSGFKLAWRNIRYQGNCRRTMSETQEVLPLSRIALSELVDLDAASFSSARGDFVRRWISQPNAIARAIKHGQRIAGYGVARRCRRGWKIGPLLANNPDTAQTLLASLAPNSEEPLYLDVPEANPQAVALAQSCGMTPMFETARMYNRYRPTLAIEQIYGVTSFELG